MGRLPLALLIAATSFAATATPAAAQSAEAEALFSEGDSLLKQGKVAEACDAFEASNRLEARAGTLIRLGECREQNKQLASAWSAYKDALTRVKDPKKKAIATAKVKELEPRLSYLTVTVPDAIRTEGLALARNGAPLDPVLWNRGIPINGGSYTIVARAPRRAEWSTTVEVPVEGGKIVVAVPALEEPGGRAPPPTPPPPAEQPPTPAVTDEPEDEGPSPSRFTPKRKLALGIGGVAIAGLAGGILLGSQATGKQDEARALCPDPATPCADADRANTLNDTARSRALLANVAFGVAGAAAIGAAVLWITGAPAATSTVAVVPGASSITVVGRF